MTGSDSSSEPVDLLIEDIDALTPSGRQRVDIAIRNGRFAAIDAPFGPLGRCAAKARVRIAGAVALPGVIDSHVHFREPGREAVEDLESGTRGAALGGVTSVVDMPNTAPPVVDEATARDRAARTTGRIHTDYGFYAGADGSNERALVDLQDMPGVVGIKLFMTASTTGMKVEGDAAIAEVLAAAHRPVAVHAEDHARVTEREATALASRNVRDHANWRDRECAIIATTRVLALARRLQRHVHILHVSTGAEVPMINAARPWATFEVLPQHLTLAAPEVYEQHGALAQMNPPIRGDEECQALWRAVRDGSVDTLGSDHGPHSLAEKQTPYPNMHAGMPGVQTLLPVMLSHVAAGRLTLERLSDLTAAGPARVLGLARKGRIAPGFDADLSIVDLHVQRRIENSWIASKVGWTIYAGMLATGWPVATLVRGRFVMRDGDLLGPPSGRLLEVIGCRQTVARQ